jgi:hypothetical protein
VARAAGVEIGKVKPGQRRHPGLPKVGGSDAAQGITAGR